MSTGQNATEGRALDLGMVTSINVDGRIYITENAQLAPLDAARWL
jgi:hypothetical protein